MPTLETIKILREKSGAGMVDCKKALEESSDDIDKAMELLRKKGIAKAAKRGERETREGIIKLAVNSDNTEGYVLEMNSETDFVALNDQFKDFAQKAIDLAKEKKPKDLAELLNLGMDGGTLKEGLDNLSGVIGEKLEIKRYDILASEGTVAAYSHMGGKIGVLVALDKKGEKNLADEIAMQIAASDPKYIIPEEVAKEEIEKEKEIYREQLKKEGKPEKIFEKIMEGKINKYFEEVCLVKQEYIKEDKKKVEDILGDVKVEKFIRYSL